MKVKFLGKNGYDSEVPHAISLGLIVNEWYTLGSMNVGRSSSTLKLDEFPNNSFNTVMFEVDQKDQRDYVEMFNNSYRNNYSF